MRGFLLLKMAKRICVAAWQGPSIRGDISGNIAVIQRVLSKAADDSVDLVVFPELFLTSYDNSIEDIRQLAVVRASEDPSCPINIIKQIAVLSGVGVCVGYPERVNESVVCNSSILIDAQGNELLNHRKMSLWDPNHTYEKVLYTPGSSVSHAKYCLKDGSSLQIGVLVCFDINFPQFSSELVASHGVELILVTAAVACSKEAYDKVIAQRSLHGHWKIKFPSLLPIQLALVRFLPSQMGCTLVIPECLVGMAAY